MNKKIIKIMDSMRTKNKFLEKDLDKLERTLEEVEKNDKENRRKESN